MFSPEYCGDMKDFAHENDNHRDQENDEKEDNFPRVARTDVTHPLYPSTAYVIRVCAHVTDTAAVAVFLNRQITIIPQLHVDSFVIHLVCFRIT